MFRNASSFNIDLSSWNIGKVNTVQNMFYEASSFNQDLSPWSVDKVTTMGGMFYKATSYNHTLCGDAWVESTADQTNMFLGAGPTAKIGTAPCSCKIGKALTIAYTYDNSAAVDCDDHYSENAKSGKYTINPGGVGAFDVYCDFDRNDGPWTGKNVSIYLFVLFYVNNNLFPFITNSLSKKIRRICGFLSQLQSIPRWFWNPRR